MIPSDSLLRWETSLQIIPILKLLLTSMIACSRAGERGTMATELLTGSNVSIVSDDSCCRKFREYARTGGIDGIRVVIVRNYDASADGFMEFRSPANRSGPFDAGTQIKFCPWCGANLSKWFGKKKLSCSKRTPAGIKSKQDRVR
jgi:hypothetical protein